LPSGIPGIGDEIDKAIQQAPQSERQIIGKTLNGVTAQRHNGAKVKK
jgi:hypothetical protein